MLEKKRIFDIYFRSRCLGDVEKKERNIYSTLNFRLILYRHSLQSGKMEGALLHSIYFTCKAYHAES